MVSACVQQSHGQTSDARTTNGLVARHSDKQFIDDNCGLALVYRRQIFTRQRFEKRRGNA